MKNRIAIFPLVSSIIGLFSSGICFATFFEKDNPMATEMFYLSIGMALIFVFILLLSIGLVPFSETKERNEIVF